MTAVELLALLGTLNVKIFAKEGSLGVNAPKGTLTPELLRLLAEHKAEFLARLPPLHTLHTETPQKKLSNINVALDAHDAHGAPLLEVSTGLVQLEPSLRRGGQCASCASSATLISLGISPSATVCNGCATAPFAQADGNAPSVVVLDFETRSLASLEEVGGRTYASHPSTEIVCLVARLANGDYVDWVPGASPPEALFHEARKGTPFLAHNALAFDRLIWQGLGWPEATWVDSMHLARQAGLPGSLDGVGEALLGVKKDLEGRRLTLSLSRPDKKTGRLPPVDPDTLRRVRRYCRSDVELLSLAWEKRLSTLVVDDVDARRVDQVINDRGFAFDRDLAVAIIESEERLARDARDDAAVPGTLLASPAKLKAWLKDAGIMVPDVQRKTLEEILDGPELDLSIGRVLYARLMSSGITSHKLNAALRRLGKDDRLRDTLAYHAAHTGRWGGRGFQPQNLPRCVQVDLEAAVAAVLRRDLGGLRELAQAAHVSVAEVLGSLVRCCVVAPEGRLLAAVDYRSIEARTLLWLAGDKEGLEIFRRGLCPYKEIAATLYRVDAGLITKPQRQLGKALELGCGYQMSAERFRTYAENYQIDWSTLAISPEQAVEAWRDAHPKVAGWRTTRIYEGKVHREGGLWRDVQAVAMQVVAGGPPVEAGRCRWSLERGDLVCTLPSGRRMVYRDARIEDLPTRWGGNKPTLTYAHHRQRVQTYGGKLVENVTQAVCRDLLSDALVRLEQEDKQLVLHVHDEVVCEVATETELETIERIVRAAPIWAAGLPLDVESYVAKRYKK